MKNLADPKNPSVDWCVEDLRLAHAIVRALMQDSHTLGADFTLERLDELCDVPLSLDFETPGVVRVRMGRPT